MIVLKKPGKADYTILKAYRPITLLNTLGKVFESVLARRISAMAEQHMLLPQEQMGARKNRSTETALELLTEQVHTIWGKSGKHVASLLCLNIAGAFDKVPHQRFLYNLRMKKIPEYLVNWVKSFLEDRRTTLAINWCKSGFYQVACGIP